MVYILPPLELFSKPFAQGVRQIQRQALRLNNIMMSNLELRSLPLLCGLYSSSAKIASKSEGLEIVLASPTETSSLVSPLKVLVTLIHPYSLEPIKHKHCKNQNLLLTSNWRLGYEDITKILESLFHETHLNFFM